MKGKINEPNNTFDIGFILAMDFDPKLVEIVEKMERSKNTKKKPQRE